MSFATQLRVYLKEVSGARRIDVLEFGVSDFYLLIDLKLNFDGSYANLFERAKAICKAIKEANEKDLC